MKARRVKKLLATTATLLSFSIFFAPNGYANPSTVLVNQNNFGDLANSGLSSDIIYTVEGPIDVSSIDFGALAPNGDVASYLGNLNAVFDGNSTTITGLIKPLFNQISAISQVKNLDLATSGTPLTATDNLGTGVLAKTSEGTITRVSVTGEINGDGWNNVGGLVGIVTSGLVDSATSTVNITDGGNNIGGLVGLVEAAVLKNKLIDDESESTDSALQEASATVTISNSTASGSVSGANDVGGLVGSAVAVIENSVSVEGTVNGSVSTGGIVGAVATVEISDSSASGMVLGIESVGGLVGSATAYTGNATFVGSNVTGSVTSQGITDSATTVSISNSTSSGTVAGSGSTGGLVGTVNSVLVNATTITSVVGSDLTSSGITSSTNSVTITSSQGVETTSATGTVTGNVESTGGLVGTALSQVSISTDFSNSQVGGNVTSVGVESSAPEITISDQTVNSSVVGQIGTGGLIGSAVADVVDSREQFGRIDGIINIAGAISSSPTIVITDTTTTGAVEGRDNTGGLIGSIESSSGLIEIVGTFVSGQVTGVGPIDPNEIPPSGDGFDTDPADSIGGLVGLIELNLGASLLIEDSHATGAVSGNVNVGGLIGIIELSGSEAEINDSSASGTVSGVSQNEWTFCLDDSCSWSSEAIEPDDIGGLIGDVDLDTTFVTIDGCDSVDIEDCQEPIANSQLTVNNSFSTSPTVSGYDSVGGLIGEITAQDYGLEGAAGSVVISNSYSTSEVFGAGNSVGGLIGSINEWYEPNSYLAQVEILSSFATGSVEGRKSVGGLVGYGWNIEILNSFAHGDVSIGNLECDPEANSCPELEYFGGLIGYSYNITLETSYASGDVTGGDYVGGLIGEAAVGGVEFNNTVSTSHATGDIRGRNYVGGLIGLLEHSSHVGHSYASGEVIGTGYNIGGLLGSVTNPSCDYEFHPECFPGLYSRIENTIAFGNVTGRDNVGGFVGSLSGEIRNSLALGNVEGIDYVGGFVGQMVEDYNSDIESSGAYGNVLADSVAGGFVGFMHNYKYIFNSFATGTVQGASAVGSFGGYAFGDIEESWSAGEVLIGGVPFDLFVGGCALSSNFCENGIPRNSLQDFEPSESPTLRPDIADQLSRLDAGRTEFADFIFVDCINNGLPHLLSLADTYVSICQDDPDDDGGDEVDNENQGELDISSILRFRLPLLTKTLVKEPISTRNFTASKLPLPASCTFKIQQEDAKYGKSGLILASADIAKSLSRISLKNEDSLQLRLSTSGEKIWDVWVNDPVCGQVKIGTTTLKSEKNEIVLLPIQFVKTGDFIISFTKPSSNSVELKFEDLAFRVIVKVNYDGSNEFLGVD